MCIGYDHGKTDEFKTAEVVDVVADERDVGGVDPAFLEQPAKERSLVAHPVVALEAELRAPCRHDPVLLRRDDQHRDARVAQLRDAQSVATMHGHAFISFAVDADLVVGHHPVEVEDNEIEPLGPCDLGRPEAGHDPVQKQRILRAVELERAPVVHRIHRDPPAEPVAKLAQDARAEDVDRSILLPLPIHVLLASSCGAVVVDRDQALLVEAPDEQPVLGRREERVCVLGQQRLDRVVDVRRRPDR